MLALPAVDALAEAFPDAELDVLVGRHSAPVFEGRPTVTAVVEIPDIPKARDVSPIAGLLRRGRYDLLVLLDRSRLLRLAVALSGARRVVRVRDPQSGFLHEGDLYLAALAELNIEARSTLPVLNGRAVDRVRPCHVSGSFVVVHPGGAMNPGALMLQKRWPADRYIELVTALRERGLEVLLTGGPDERELAAKIARKAGLQIAANLAGQLSLPQVAALIGRAQLYIGADTGVSHLAAATGTPSVVIFGPTNPLRYGPRGAQVEIVAPAASYQLADVDLRRAPGVVRSVATTQVSLDDVLAACERLLQPSGAS